MKIIAKNYPSVNFLIKAVKDEKFEINEHKYAHVITHTLMLGT